MAYSQPAMPARHVPSHVYHAKTTCLPIYSVCLIIYHTLYSILYIKACMCNFHIPSLLCFLCALLYMPAQALPCHLLYNSCMLLFFFLMLCICLLLHFYGPATYLYSPVYSSTFPNPYYYYSQYLYYSQQCPNFLHVH